MADTGIIVSVDASNLQGYSRRLTSNLDLVGAVARIVKKHANRAQAQAILNVSGVLVQYSGGVFTIARQSGKLAQSIQIQRVTYTSALIRATAKYADAIEGGVEHPVDLKPYLMGKTIPIKLKGQNGNKYVTYPVMTGLLDGSPAGNSHQGPTAGIKKVARKASTGALTGHDYIIFRKVTPRSKGWIIPPRPKRPFMEAAAEKIEPDFSKEVADTLQRYVEG